MSASKFGAELEEAAGFIGHMKAGERGGIEHALAHALVNRAGLLSGRREAAPDAVADACRALADENGLSLCALRLSSLENADFASAFAALCLALHGRTPDPTLGAEGF
ncbi:MAG: hypothetical protein HXY22_11260 [Alphaproteobacteria bacterium]|nr:hypothetical protein [Alphaproteobacteria bacterium]